MANPWTFGNNNNVAWGHPGGVAPVPAGPPPLPWVQQVASPGIRQIMNAGGQNASFWSRFIIKKFEVNNFFAYYRAGLGNDPQKPWLHTNSIQNPRSVLYRDVSKYRRVLPPWENIDRADSSVVQRAPQRWRRYRAPPPSSGRQPTWLSAERKGGASAKNYQDLFASKGADINIKKILGAGGNGVALLCDAPTATPGRRKKFVLKASLRGQDMTKEKMYVTVGLASTCIKSQVLSTPG